MDLTHGPNTALVTALGKTAVMVLTVCSIAMVMQVGGPGPTFIQSAFGRRVRGMGQVHGSGPAVPTGGRYGRLELRPTRCFPAAC